MTITDFYTGKDTGSEETSLLEQSLNICSMQQKLIAELTR